MHRKVPLDLDGVRKRARYFGKLFGVDTAFRIRRPPRIERTEAGVRAV
jgi:hypothetical protein